MPAILTLLEPRPLDEGTGGGLGASLSRYFRHTRGWLTHDLRWPCHPRDAGTALPLRDAWPPLAFRQVADQLERFALENGGPSGLRDVVVVVELTDEPAMPLDQLSPTAVNRGPWASALAMLILAFPEIHWVLFTPRRFTPSVQPTICSRVHLLGLSRRSCCTIEDAAALLDAGLCPLFDPTGLRDLIRGELPHATDDHERGMVTYVPRRRQLAAAVDEEISYAFLTAYAAYRFGFRSAMLCTYAMMTRALGSLDEAAHNPVLVFEDIFIDPPDRPHHVSLSSLATRDEQLPRLRVARYRVLVTVGHSRAGRDDLRGRNDDYRQGTMKDRAQRSRYLYKPLSGIFDLWDLSGVRAWLRRSNGQAPGFAWPPSQTGDLEAVGGHSAPGRLLAVAERLIQRAEHMLDETHSVADALHGATLALDAVEYLGHRTPTTSLAALSLQHRLEVEAECLFYGVEQSLDVRRRFVEMRHHVASISFWFARHRRALFATNAELALVNPVLQVFRQHNRFDEEQACMAEVRRLNRRIWLSRHAPWSWFAWLPRWYVESLLGDLRRFLVVIAVWIVVLGALFGSVRHKGPNDPDEARSSMATGIATERPRNATEGSQATPPSPPTDGVVHGFRHGVRDAVTSFFGMQPAHDDEPTTAGLLLTVLAILAGFAHLGVFVSHLYSMIARR